MRKILFFKSYNFVGDKFWPKKKKKNESPLKGQKETKTAETLMKTHPLKMQY